MPVTFAIEPLARCWNELVQIAHAHWKETEGYRHAQPFCPKLERYEPYERAGWFFMVTAREASGRLVGYAGMYCTPSMHTQQLIATEDTYFLLPEARKGRTALQLYQFIEAECRQRGAVEISMTAKLTNKAGRIMEYLGFQATALQYTKSLLPTAHP